MSHTPKIPGINNFNSLTIGGDVKMTGLPTSDPEENDKLWNDTGLIKISAGTVSSYLLAENNDTLTTENENLIIL